MKLDGVIDNYEVLQKNVPKTLEGWNEFGDVMDKAFLELIGVLEAIIADTDAVDVEANTYLSIVRTYRSTLSKLSGSNSMDNVVLNLKLLDEEADSFNDAEFQLRSEMEKKSKID